MFIDPLGLIPTAKEAHANYGAYDVSDSGYSGQITSYVIKNEPLNNIVGNNAISSVIYLPRQHSGWNSHENHSIAAVIDGIRGENPLMEASNWEYPRNR